MEESDLDSWYEQEKNNAFQQFLEELNQGKKGAEERYKKRIKLIREKYYKMYDELRNPSFFKRLSLKIRNFMSGLIKIYKERKI